MPNFKYKIRDKYGKASTGTIEGESKEAVASHFKKMEHTPTFIEEIGHGLQSANPFFEKFFKGVKLEELIIFTRQLMTLQRAGVPILSSLNSIREQLENKYFKEIIEKILHDVESGISLSESCAKYPDVFPEVYTHMLTAGEASGQLEDILKKLGDLLEHELDIRMKVKQATRYPLLVLIAISLAFPLAVIFIIPKFADLFTSFNTALPIPTRILLGLNYIFVHFWFLIVSGLIAFIYLFRKVSRMERIRPAWDRLKLKMPVFGQLFLKIALSRFAKITSILIASGIPIISALEIVKGSVGNRVIADSIETIAKGISKGNGIALSMKASGLYPGIVIQMVKIGEDTGQLDNLLMRTAEYYDTQIDYTVKNLAVLVEPMLILVLGVMVLFLALGIFLPMWNLSHLYIRMGGL